MTKRDRLLLQHYSAVPHQRFGNERAWSVTGGDLILGQVVHMHAMCGKTAAILKAIKQDDAEQDRIATRQDEADDTSVFSTGQQGKLTATGIEALFSGRRP